MVHHQIAFRKLSRTPAHRKALLRNMATQLLIHGRIKTTTAKAKELKRVADKLVKYAKKADKAYGRRLARSFLRTDEAVENLFVKYGPLYADRPGGYTRVQKTRPRAGDCAPMAYVEYVPESVEEGREMRESRRELRRQRFEYNSRLKQHHRSQWEARTDEHAAPLDNTPL
eukprot:TRINITY_DN13781_c0_g1_i2.p1 TRINITY_DN13781_c0_g1~~TRINITY_DN13781_c0_g1_i2.p1  ORF type:complete len:185 (+),score=62.87 TRINITY_DN13781_c0_g1_i2:43-555(+)